MARITDTEKRQVALDLNQKLRLEAIFRPKVKALFSKIVKAYRAGIIKTGRSISARDFGPAWNKLIFDHQRRVQRSFKKQQEDDDEEILLLALLLWAENNSIDSAEEITITNQKNMELALIQARQMVIDQGLSLDNRTLATTAAALLTRKFDGRIAAIQSFETQAAAESTKLTVAEIEAGIEPSVLSGVVAQIGVIATKKWVTVGDNKVRVKPFNHRAANGQVKNINQPFEVSDQLLRFPGDKSLGASVGNIVNCRCSAIYRQ
jgi:hypothetical protein